MSTTHLRIGVLALQGAFSNHIEKLQALGVETFEIRQLKDLDYTLDGLILPGGESTTQGKLLHELGLYEPLRQRIVSGLPVYGTCAGLVLLAESIIGQDNCHLGVMSVAIKRNAYGRQLESFIAYEDFANLGLIEMPFIRAPYIDTLLSEEVEVLSRVDGHIVAAKQNHMLVTSFHPEVTDSTSVHQYFLDMVVSIKTKRSCS